MFGRYEIRFYNAKSGPSKNYTWMGARRYYTLSGARNKWWQVVQAFYPDDLLVFYILDHKTGKEYPRDFEVVS